MRRLWLAAALMLAGIGAAWAISPAQQIIVFGRNSSASSPPPATCSGTGLIFTSACNSQYIGIL